MLEIIGLIIAMFLLVFLAMKGTHVLLIALICSLVLGITSGMDLYPLFKETYMAGFVSFVQANYLMFLAGAVFGKFMTDSHAADAIAEWIVRKLGADKALFATVLSCAILCYGGVSVFVVGFTMFPIAISLFKEADLPRRFLPGTLAFGSATFAMTSPGTPQSQNIIPTQSLETTAMAGTTIGFICLIFTFVVGMIWLTSMVKKAKAKGEHFEAKANEEIKGMEKDSLPNAGFAVMPLIVAVVCLNVLKIPVEVSIFLGVIVGYILMHKYIEVKAFPSLFGASAVSSFTAIANTSAVVGFGAVVKTIPLFQTIVDNLLNIPGPALLGAALAVTIVCGLTGSASGGLGIGVPLVAPAYIARGVAPAAIHRVASIASGALDTVPHNGYVVTLLNLCGETHKDAYMPIFWLTVVLTGMTMVLAIILFELFPMLP